MEPIAALAFLGTLVFSAPAALLPLLAAFNPRRIWVVRLTVLSIGLGPILLAFLVTTALTLVPGMSTTFYKGAVLGTLLVIVILARKERHRARAALQYLVCSLTHRRERGPIFRLGVLTALFIVMTLVGLSIAMPLDENDALEYAGSARAIYNLGSAVSYPFLDSNITGGYYGPWSHALGYISLQVWGFLIQGHAAEAGVIKLIAPFFALCTALVVWIWLGGARRTWAIWGAVVLLSTPLFYLSSSANQIDAIRLFAFFGAGMILPLAWGTQRIMPLVACGAVAGSALFTHSIGILAIPIVGLVLLLKSPFGLRRSMRQATIVCSVAIALVSYRLVDNVILFGSPIADVGAVPVYALPGLDWIGYFRESRDLGTPVERILYGLFAGLTRPNIYGLSYWLLCAAIILYLRRGTSPRSVRELTTKVWNWVRTSRDPAAVAGLILLIFGGMVITSVLVGIDAFIKNVRYLLTVQPYVALFSVAVLGPAVSYTWSRHGGRLRTLSKSTVAVGFALACIAIPSYFNYSKLRAFDLVGPQILDSDARKRAISKAGYVRVPAYAAAHLPQDALILTFQQAQLAFYGRHRFLSDIDPKLIPFYQQTDADAAHAELYRLGVTHLMLPGYAIPTVYNSAIDKIIAHPERVELIYEVDGNRLYRLRPHAATQASQERSPPIHLPLAVNGSAEWTTWDRRHEYAVPSRINPDSGMLEVEQKPLVSLRRAESRIYSGRGPIELTPSQASSQIVPVVECGRIHRVLLDAAGSGSLDVSVVFYPPNAPPQWRTIWQGLLDDKPRTIAATFDALWMPAVGERCQRAEVRVVARLFGRGSLGVHNARIEPTAYASASASWLKQIAARENAWQIVSDSEPQLAEWGVSEQGKHTELYMDQMDRRALALRSRTVELPYNVKTVEFQARTYGRGMFAVRFECQVLNEDDAADWLIGWIRRTLSLPNTNTLTGGGRAFAGPAPVKHSWQAAARGCDHAYVQIDLIHSSAHRGLPAEYARLNLIDPQLHAITQDGRRVALFPVLSETPAARANEPTH